MFEKATRLKVRFPYKGLISVEDLWDLSVTELDSIFKALNAKLKLVNEESLLGEKSKADKLIELQVEIIKHVVSVKLKETNDQILAKERREKKQKIMDILVAKQDSDLQNKSAEELQKMLNDLD